MKWIITILHCIIFVTIWALILICADNYIDDKLWFAVIGYFMWPVCDKLGILIKRISKWKGE
jgi:hypothetical protein